MNRIRHPLLLGLSVLLPATGLAAPAPTAAAAETGTTNPPPSHLLLISPLGEPVPVPTNALPRGLLPPAGRSLDTQVPTAARGGPVPEPVRQRQADTREGHDHFEFFPSHQPRLGAYLASQDEMGNTAIKPGPLLPASPLDIAVQQARYRSSEFGLRYSLAQTLTWVSLSDVQHGSDNLGFYTLSFHSKWSIYDDPPHGTAGWISSKIGAKTGLGDEGDTQSASRNLGSAASPTGIWSSLNGFRIPELAWQQSLAHGDVVVVAGMVNQSDYFDANSYANSGRGQFLNSALINSMVLPLPGYNFGLNVQWQIDNAWYALLGGSAGHGHAGVAPWTDFAWDNWSALGEIGYAPADFLGLGPGVYRFQPFVGQTDGDPLAEGFGVNFQQQLGRHSPVGWFARYGRGGEDRWQVSSGSESAHSGSQLGTGFALRGPLHLLGLLPDRIHDAAGLGFVWSHPDAETKTVQHPDEYTLELGYVLQLTPTAKLQPDFQVVWNRAYNPDPDPATVFQLQLDLTW